MTFLARAATVLFVAVMVGGIGVGAWAWSTGYRLYAVQTGSMSPAYPTGDLIITEPPASSYAVGDVVTFRAGGGPASVITHRVHAVDGASLETKGDANETADAVPISASDVVGRVIGAVPRGGFVLVFLKQPTGGPAVLAVLVALVVLWKLFFPTPERLAPSGVAPDGDRPRDERNLERQPTPRHGRVSGPRATAGT